MARLTDRDANLYATSRPPKDSIQIDRYNLMLNTYILTMYSSYLQGDNFLNNADGNIVDTISETDT